MLYFTSDTHFDHANILKYGRERFSSVEDMNTALINNWNSVVEKEDTIIHAGDFALGKAARWPEFGQALSGHKILVLGNHDGTATKMLGAGFDEVYKELYYTHEGITFWVAHIPPGETDRLGRAYIRPSPTRPRDVTVCGHVHTAWRVHDGTVNVGVDVWDYHPVSALTVLVASRGPNG